MQSVKPLVPFSKLKEVLQKKGISIVSSDSGYVASSHIISNIDTRSGSLEISEGGIFYTTPDGLKHRGFLYLMDSIGSSYPKAHICECSTLQDFKSARKTYRYIWSNRTKVFIKASGGGGVFEVDGLDICKNCLSALNGYRIPGFPRTTKDFVRRLETDSADALFPNHKVLDIFGRTPDWYFVRQDYLERVNYTCEECGRVFDQIDMRPYLDVIHVNGHLEQNVFHNLKCLCVDCRKKLYPDQFRNSFSDNIFELYDDRFNVDKKKRAISALIGSLQCQFDSIILSKLK